MQKQQSLVASDLARSVDELYLKFGIWRMASALLIAIWHRRRKPNRIADLNNYLRRDIGLSDEEDLSASQQFFWWNVRP